ncbi:MAG: aminotransferase class III-fold pyridoxal phosphate-dependent enzyme [Pseudomonadota bacterium]
MANVNWPFIPAPMPEITGSDGVYLEQADGRRILDAAGGAIVANIGHGRERVVTAVAEATRNTTYVVPPWITPGRKALVEVLARDWLPSGLAHVHLTSGGSEAVETAVKLALQYHAARGETERGVVIARVPSYHGTTLTTASLSGHAARKRGLEAALSVHPVVPTPNRLRLPEGVNATEAGQWYANTVAEAIEAAGPERVAAFLAEPITGSSGGALVPPDDYWPAVRAICDRYGVLLIVDEVMTGFGRTGKPFGYQHWDFEPDILVGGKGLAGGYAPLGGVFASTAIGEAIREAEMNVMFHTFGAHPAACAAAAEVLNILTEENLVERAALMGEKLQNALRDRLGQHPHVAEVRGRGLLQAVEIVADRDSLEPFPEADGISGRIVAEGLKEGVFFYGGGTGDYRDVVCMGPPFIIEDEHVAVMADTLATAINRAVA